jgi:hypothetical protein
MKHDATCVQNRARPLTPQGTRLWNNGRLCDGGYSCDCEAGRTELSCILDGAAR